MTSRESLVHAEVPFTGVLIGGGQPQNGKSNWPDQDPLLDAGLALAQPENPNVLLITSARWASSKSVTEIVAGYGAYYSRRGLKTDVLHPYLFPEGQSFEDPALDKTPFDPARLPSQAELTDKIEAADVFFVLGGDANRMLNQIWRPLGIDTLLKSAAERGAVISGTSAGCLAWFEGGHTDSSSLKHEPTPPEYNDFRYLLALGWLANAICCPHYDRSPEGRPREPSFAAMMADHGKSGQVGIGIDNDVALQIVNGADAQVLKNTLGEGRKTLQTVTINNGSLTTATVDGNFKLSELGS